VALNLSLPIYKEANFLASSFSYTSKTMVKPGLNSRHFFSFLKLYFSQSSTVPSFSPPKEGGKEGKKKKRREGGRKKKYLNKFSYQEKLASFNYSKYKLNNASL
jgi:hypothetical protein